MTIDPDAAIVAVGGAALGIGVSIGQALMADELKGWIHRVPFLVVRIAAMRLPRQNRDRYRSEWLAELSFALQDPDEGL